MQELLPISAICQEVSKRYGNRTNFLSTFHVNKQPSFAKFPDRCFFGTAPTLNIVNACYGEGTSEEWLVYQLADLSEYCGAREKLSGNQIRQLAINIKSEFGHLNVAELMLFFYRFKLGHYGHFYGSIDPIIIAKTLRNDFRIEQMEASNRKKQIELEKERDEWRKNAITYEEYMKLKKEQEKEDCDGIQD